MKVTGETFSFILKRKSAEEARYQKYLNFQAKVKSIIQDYFLAINDQNWSKAKNCCVYGSDRYYATCVLEDGINALQQIYGTVTITCFVNISNVSVSGSYASAYINVTLYVTAGYYFDSDSVSGYYYLQKVGNTWKNYAP